VRTSANRSVGGARNLSDAARGLRVSHTTVARRLEAVGRALEVRLVERTADGLRLTSDGTELARLAEPMEAAADAMTRRICASKVSLPTRSAIMTKLPVPFNVPAVT
jgi:DNA-binding transcriptional LysR family regulator